MENDARFIVETTEESFEADVFERSKHVPVVVDFWAAWCGPCRMLAPLLEQMAAQYEGKFILVKADTDQVPRAAGEFNVQSIPAVYAVVDGDVVDFFQGVLPEEQLRQWIEAVLSHGAASEARQLEASDPAAAEEKYRELLESSPNDALLSIGLGRVLLAQDRAEETRQLIQELEKRGFLEPEAEQLKASLELRGKKSLDLDQLQTDAASNPDDLNLQLQLAEALGANGQYQQALDVGLQLVQRDKKGFGDQARQVMVDIFRVADDEELVRQYRRKLSAALY